MARNRDPFATALRVLSEQAVSGAFAPRASIVILSQAEALRLSTTPIREALAWLGGEGLIERSPAGGYVGLGMDPQQVAGRYRLRGLCLSQALHLAVGLPTLARCDGGSAEALFSRIMRSSADPVLIDAYDRVQRQLSALVESEQRILAEDGEGLVDIRKALSRDEVSNAVAAMAAYHRRRIEVAALIAEAFLERRRAST